MENLSPELLIIIFSSIHPKELIKCREVCRRWNSIINMMFRNEKLWRKHCVKEFGNVNDIKSISGLSWHNLYRSLSLWTQLSRAKETQRLFFGPSYLRQEILGGQLLSTGIIGVHKEDGIVYCNTDTLQEATNLNPMPGDYIRYAENNNARAVLAPPSYLNVFHKSVNNPASFNQTTFPNIKNFFLKTNELFYITCDGKIYFCNLNAEVLSSNLVLETSRNIICIEDMHGSFTELTSARQILIISDDNCISHFRLKDNTMHLLKQYNYVENNEWCNYGRWFPWLYPSVIKLYFDYVFVGNKFGDLLIYRDPFINNELNLSLSTPIKQYNLSYFSQCSFRNHIVNIEILEIKDGHKVFVVTKEKIVIIKFSHDIVNVSDDL